MTTAKLQEYGIPAQFHTAIIGLIYLIIHVLGVGLSVLFSFVPNDLEQVAVFWPAAGILVAALLLSSKKRWWVLLAVSFIGQVVGDFIWVDRSNVPLSLLFGLANSSEAFLAAYLLRHFVNEKLTFTSFRDVLGFAVLGVTISPLLGATLGALVLRFSLVSANSYWLDWQLWWASDALGILTVTPFVLAWVEARNPAKQPSRPVRLLEGILLFSSLLLLLWLIFDRNLASEASFFELPYLIFPFLMWAAIRFRPNIATLAYLLVTVFAIWLTNRSGGPFAVAGQSGFQDLLNLQLFLAVNTLSSLVLTAVFTELKQTQHNLQQFSAAEQHARQQADALRAASVALSQSLDMLTVLEHLLDYLAKLIPFDTATVMLLDDEGALQVWVVRGREPNLPPEQTSLPYRAKSSSLIEKLLATQHSVRIEDAHLHPEWEYRERNRYVRSWLGVPLVAQGQTLGLYSLSKQEPGFFTEEHQLQAEALAVQAAVAVVNARLYAQVEASVQELEGRVQGRTAELEQQYLRQSALAEVELSINQPHERQTVLDRIVEVVTELLPATGGASIILWDEHNGTTAVSASNIPGQPPQMGASRVRTEGATNWVITQKRPLLVPNIQEDPFGANPMLREYGLNAYVGLPLLAGETVLGVLYALDKQPRDYKEDDLSFLTAVAGRAAIAIDKVQLYEQTVQRAAELKALYDVGKEISAQLELDVVLQTIATKTKQLTGADKSLIMLVDLDRRQLIRTVGEGYTETELLNHTFEEFEQGISGWVMQNKEPALIDDLLLDDRNRGMALQNAKTMPDKALAVAPLLVENRAVGTLTIVNGRTKPLFTRSELDLTVLLAGQAAIAIRNAQLYHAAQEADRLKSAFLASMSHELRTPLNSIIGFTGIILQELAGPLNDEQRKQMGMVRTSAHHLLNLINDVLDISKIEAGQLEVAHEPCNVPQIITKVLQLLQPLADKKGLLLTAVVDPQIDEIMSDARRVEQILINLVNNGIKFTDAGGVHIRCRAQQKWLHFEVIDTGIGIQAEDMAKLFRPFQQLKSGLDRMHEGTGLGLSICHRLVHLLGGEISVKSVLGEGSTFSFTLPRKASTL
ncbi:MAG: GAF domain-containing protein [Ardenticatenaceae bacterium]|nr:GAF domain-containing protein [Ardenticatenaceae bacterium]